MSKRLPSGRRGAVILLYALILAAPAVAEDGPAPASTLPPGPSDLTRFLPSEDLERDGHRTLGELPKNLGRSFVGVFSKDNVAPFLIGVTGASASYIVDSHAQSGFTGRAPGISNLASTAGGSTYMLPATLGLFAAGRLATNGRFRAFSYDTTQALVVNTVYTQVLKHAVSRTRPDGSDQLSFPSGHASSAFVWAAMAQAHYGWKAGAPSYLAATMIGLSRISRDKHHLSDVVAGATLGYISARTVLRVNGEPVGRHKTFTLHPVTDAGGTGVGVGASFSW
jgi:membrane-associated phospholipid phosphatase